MSVAKPIELVVDEETRVVSAIYQPDGNPLPPTRELLVAAVRERGWPEEVLDEELVSAFLHAGLMVDGTVRLPVGALLDGTFELYISPDHMSAELTVTPPRGGVPVTEEQVRAALNEKGIVSGILDDALRQAVILMTGEPVRIAEGRPPQPGKPTHFESLIEALKKRQDEDDENAIIDYRDMGKLTLVSPNDPLMRRIPAVPGEPGEDVLGTPIEPEPVTDQPFADKLSGVTTDPEDPCLLLASIAGVPVVVDRGVTVNALVEIESVDLSTGNIDFDGALRVRGDITMGMRVRVSGDLVVNGTIEAAEVHAGGNITVNGGIIGMAETISSDGHEQSRAARITCGGTVKARFISNAEVDAAKNVAVEREIRQSHIIAGESVLVGPPGTQNGVITGGKVQALKSVQAGSIGSMSAPPTEIHVGLDPHAQTKRAAIAAERQDLIDKKEKLEKLILFLHANPQKDVNGVGERARQTLQMIVTSQADLETREAELIEELKPLESATITAKKSFFSGVRLHIVDKVMEIFEDQIGGKAGLTDEAIVIR